MIQLEIKNKLFCVAFALLFSVSLVLPLRANAAEFFFIATPEKPATGELFKVDFLLNTEEENINAVAGKVVFSSDLLELKEVRDGNSMVNLWIDRPALKNDGEITFSGITPGGYHGANGLLFSLIFHSLKSGKISINLVDGKALLNDGRGTAAKLSAPTLTLSTVEKSEGEQINYDIIDKTPPESFVPEIAQDSSVEGNKWFVVFATQDKESGIDHYEIRETRRKTERGTDADWVRAASPYVLQDQTLQSYVYIKAVDKSGNSAIAVINPKKLPFSYTKLLVYGIILMAIVFFGIIKPRVWRKKGG